MHLKSTNHTKYFEGINDGCIDWSPDGEWIAFSGAPENSKWNHSLGIYLVKDGNPNNVIQLTATDGKDPAWSPDGEWIVFSTDLGLHLIRSDGTDEKQILAMKNITFPVWQP